MSASDRKITVRTVDGTVLSLEEDVARESERLKNCFDKLNLSTCDVKFYMPKDVTADAVAEAFEYCRKSLELRSKFDPEMKNFDFEFPKDKVKRDCDRFALVRAADYLRIKHPHDMFVDLVFKNANCMAAGW